MYPNVSALAWPLMLRNKNGNQLKLIAAFACSTQINYFLSVLQEPISLVLVRITRGGRGCRNLDLIIDAGYATNTLHS